MKAKITVINLGQNFAHMAIVEVRGKRVYETREIPFGMSYIARSIAEEWAISNGYKV